MVPKPDNSENSRHDRRQRNNRTTGDKAVARLANLSSDPARSQIDVDDHAGRIDGAALLRNLRHQPRQNTLVGGVQSARLGEMAEGRGIDIVFLSAVNSLVCTCLRFGQRQDMDRSLHPASALEKPAGAIRSRISRASGS